MKFKFKVAIRNPRVRSAVGAALAALCGLALWKMPLGERWVNASYDYLFRLGQRPFTNVVLILMQAEGHPPKPWDRGRHAQLVSRLADEKCPLLVFDAFFREASDTPTDRALLTALRRLDKVAIMAWQEEDEHPETPSKHPVLPAAAFLAAARTNWGIAWFDPDLDGIVRKHWPPPPHEPNQSLSWKAAELAGVALNNKPEERWLRYYGFNGPGTLLDYSHTPNQVAGYFSDKIVFIGNKPATTVPDRELDEFSTPYTLWEKEACGGVNLVATAFLNLVNNEWLRRAAWPIEVAVILLTSVIGAGLCRLRPMRALWAAAGCALLVTLAAVALTHNTNFWFPWLVVAGGQVPCALVWGWVTRPRADAFIEEIIEHPLEPEPVLEQPEIEAPDYEFIGPAFAEGSFGKVWLVRNAVGQWQALKGVYADKFGQDRLPYEQEFHGVSNYKPISDKHPGLLRVDFVSRQKFEGYFYYVMELGDAMTPGWENDPTAYKPRSLSSVIHEALRHRLPVAECIRIVGLLAEALDFLHQQGFTHRDIKPSNIIFVKGRPKLADVGLLREIRPLAEIKTLAGTIPYMPPPPEMPGTVVADIYALGMVLYVISTGNKPALYPDLSSTLARSEGPDFIRLNSVILRACDPDPARRYASAAEFCAAIAEAQKLSEKLAGS